MARLLGLAERAYMGEDCGDPKVTLHIKNFSMVCLDNVDIRMVFYREQLEMLQTVYEKALTQSKLS